MNEVTIGNKGEQAFTAPVAGPEAISAAPNTAEADVYSHLLSPAEIPGLSVEAAAVRVPVVPQSPEVRQAGLVEAEIANIANAKEHPDKFKSWNNPKLIP